MPTGTAAPAAKPQSHRVYWQQRLSGNGSSSSVNSNNNLITGSAAVKISHSARACDLTNLLRKTLHLGGSSSNNKNDGGDAKGKSNQNDSLVLVGTLRSVPTDYVRFEHEQEPHSSSPNEENIPSDIVNEGGSVTSSMTSASMMEDFHVVKTLDANDRCLSVLQDVKVQLLERQRAMDLKISKTREAASPTRRNVLSLRPTIAPQTRWYYVPDTTPENASKQPTMSSCLELDGYVTSFDEEEESDDENDCNSDNDAQGIDSDDEAFYGDDEDLLRRALAPFDDESDESEDLEEKKSTSKEDNQPIAKRNRRRKRSAPTAERIAREWRRYLQISQSHSAADKTNASTSTLAGFLLKRSSNDPHVWKRHYCVLTQDDFWYVPRVVRPDEFLPSQEEEKVHDEESTPDFETRTIEIAPSHGRILLAEATLLNSFQAKTRKDGFELVSGDGKTHKFRACSPTVSAGAATLASIASAKEWQRMIQTRIRDALENAFTKHAELLLTEETVARNDRWRNFLLDENETGIPPLLKNGNSVIGQGSDLDSSENLRSRVLRFGLDVAEYKEGCRQIQTLLWADMAGRPSSSSAAVGAIKKLLKQLWREATSLLNEAIELNATIVGNSTSNNNTVQRRGLETLCHHIEYVITQKRRRPSQQSLKESASSDSMAKSEASVSGDRKRKEDYPHQRDPPPIDLFDLLWNELRTLG